MGNCGFFCGNKINYLYSSDGSKLKKMVYTDNSLTSTKTYTGSFVYNDEGLEYALFEEGRLIDNSGTFEYQYFLKDHLGNTRVTFSGNDGLIKQQDHYYPFGMNFSGIVNAQAANIANQYKYNGKELQDNFGLNWYDYGARFYDVQLGLWHTVDPMAEIYYSTTPYNYVANNPIRLIDPNGMSYKESMDEQYGEGNYWYRGQAPGTWGGNSEASMADFNLNIQSNSGIFQSEGNRNDGNQGITKGDKIDLSKSSNPLKDVLDFLHLVYTEWTMNKSGKYIGTRVSSHIERKAPKGGTLDAADWNTEDRGIIRSPIYKNYLGIKNIQFIILFENKDLRYFATKPHIGFSGKIEMLDWGAYHTKTYESIYRTGVTNEGIIIRLHGRDRGEDMRKLQKLIIGDI